MDDVEAILTEIKRLYYETTAGTIDRDFARAIDLIKQLPDEDTRGRVDVYMEGLAEMRREWDPRSTRKEEAPRNTRSTRKAEDPRN